jgi:tRNA uridine 5-carbamoylmethylation protein Kti12
MLVVFGGLPGTGKTTLARALAQHRQATYLRIDTIEQALRSARVLVGEVGPAGYLVAYALAEANLKPGQLVIADCVNPCSETREAWRAVAAAAKTALLEIETICSDPVEHRRRVENRIIDIPGFIPPSWHSVSHHDYTPWREPRLVLDTALLDVSEAVAVIFSKMAATVQA